MLRWTGNTQAQMEFEFEVEGALEQLLRRQVSGQVGEVY